MENDSDLVAARPSLRVRKKRATRLSLRRCALDLVSARGFAQVTVEDIADAAGVSSRTFFNYFASKEAALFGADPDRTDALRRRLIHRPGSETALEALREVLVGLARTIEDEFVELGGDQQSWCDRLRALQADPHLRAAQAAHMAGFERILAEALAERLGTNPERDPYPVLLASVAVGVMRAVMSNWAASGGGVALEALTDAACQALAHGLPEDCELRRLVDPSRTGGLEASALGRSDAPRTRRHAPNPKTAPSAVALTRPEVAPRNLLTSSSARSAGPAPEDPRQSKDGQ